MHTDHDTVRIHASHTYMYKLVYKHSYTNTQTHTYYIKQRTQMYMMNHTHAGTHIHTQL